MAIKINTYSSLDKIFSDSGPINAPEKSASALLGEVYNFQVGIYSDKGYDDVKVIVQSRLMPHIKVYQIDDIIANLEHGKNSDDYVLTREDKMYPELLSEKSDYSIKEKKHTGFFISATIDKNCTAGNYPMEVSFFDSQGGVIGSVEYNLEVIGSELEKTDLMITHWMHYDCICEEYNVEVFSDEFYEIFEKYLKEYVFAGSTMLLIPTFTPALDTAVGSERMTTQLVKVYKSDDGYTFDFQKLDKFIDFVSSRGIKYFELAHLFTQWGAEFCPKITAEIGGVEQKIFGWETSSVSAEYTEFLKAYLPKLYEYTVNKGIKDRCFYHLSDEPHIEHLERYLQLYNTVKSITSDIVVIDALSNFEFFSNNAVDLPVVATNHAQKFLDNKIDHIPYYCCTQCVDYVANRFFAMPSERSRVLGLQLYLNEAKGFLQWGFNFYNSRYSVKKINPYEETSAGGAFPSGDAFIVYPTEKGVKISTRLLVLAEAFQDYRALMTLERKIGREKTLELFKGEQISGYDNYPHSAEWLKNFREKINSAIKKTI